MSRGDKNLKGNILRKVPAFFYLSNGSMALLKGRRFEGSFRITEEDPRTPGNPAGTGSSARRVRRKLSIA
jgi:hypothetical protein